MKFIFFLALVIGEESLACGVWGLAFKVGSFRLSGLGLTVSVNWGGGSLLDNLCMGTWV